MAEVGTPLPGSTVHLSWGTLRTQNDSTIHQTTTKTENGVYIFCDVPQATHLSAWGETLGLTSQRAEFFFEEGESTREDLRIQIRSVYGAISGVILDAVTQEPIEAATITLTAVDASTLTSSNGRFQFDEVPIGTHEAIIHHVAYGDPSLMLTVSPTLNAYVNIELDPRPIALKPISVEVTMRRRWLENNGFYDRQSRSLGQFVTPEEIDRQPYRTFAEVLRTLPGVNLRTVCTPHCAVLIRMGRFHSGLVHPSLLHRWEKNWSAYKSERYDRPRHACIRTGYSCGGGVPWDRSDAGTILWALRFRCHLDKTRTRLAGQTF